MSITKKIEIKSRTMTDEEWYDYLMLIMPDGNDLLNELKIYCHKQSKVLNEQSKNLIEMALGTPAGRLLLANALSGETMEKIALDYHIQVIGAKLLMVDELPEGEFVTYAKVKEMFKEK